MSGKCSPVAPKLSGVRLIGSNVLKNTGETFWWATISLIWPAGHRLHHDEKNRDFLKFNCGIIYISLVTCIRKLLETDWATAGDAKQMKYFVTGALSAATNKHPITYWIVFSIKTYDIAYCIVCCNWQEQGLGVQYSYKMRYCALYCMSGRTISLTATVSYVAIGKIGILTY
jgi:hypothetical protein